MTGDRDALQLVTERTHVLYTRRGITDTVEFDPQTVQAVYGVSPAQIPDLKGLMGDSSDNIPGVPGVGEKTAVRLLAQYGTLEETLRHAQEQKGKVGERLQEHRAQAEQSLWLATICRDAPLPLALEDCRLGTLSGARDAFEALSFRSLLPRLEQIIRARGGQDAAPGEQRPSSRAGGAGRGAGAGHSGGRWRGGPRPPRSARWRGDRTLPWPIPAAARACRCGRICSPRAWTPATPSMRCAPCWKGRAPCGCLTQSASCMRWTAWACDWMERARRTTRSCPAGCFRPSVRPARSRPRWARGWRRTPARCGDICERHAREMEDAGMTALYRDIEMPLMRALLDMEREGFAVDRAELERLGDRFTALEKRTARPDL